MVSGTPGQGARDAAKAPLLEVRDLRVHFPFKRGHLFRRARGVVRAVDGVSFSVEAGQTMGLVGESGCGKSTLARAIVGLTPPTSGQVLLEGGPIDWANASTAGKTRRVAQMVFQDPFASLNPRMTVGRIVAEPMVIHNLHARGERQLQTLRLLDLVGLNPKFINRYPHEFSGGQRQRVGIARALAVEPKLILCDEPVSALDVSIRAQVVNLLVDLQKSLNLTYVFIGHDLSIVRHVSDTIGVMYLGRIVEIAKADSLYRSPRHPYTRALLSAAPIPDPKVERTRRRTVLKGEIPTPDRAYTGCAFADRCPIVEARCRQSPPALLGGEHKVACFVAQDEIGAR